jgi:hypothetical protein
MNETTSAVPVCILHQCPMVARYQTANLPLGQLPRPIWHCPMCNYDHAQRAAAQQESRP